MSDVLLHVPIVFLLVQTGCLSGEINPVHFHDEKLSTIFPQVEGLPESPDGRVI